MNFFAYCEDEAVRIKVEGMPIHKFFSPEEFLLYGLEPKSGNFKGYTQIIDMPIEEFLGLSEPIPSDDLKRHSSMEEFKKDVLAGKSMKWDIPYLTVKENEDGIWKVIGHDGRHRGLLLQSLGYKDMPVRIDIPDVELNEELLPEILWSQNDKSVKRDKDFYPFPINEENFMQPYVSISNGVAVIGTDGNSFAMDEDIYPAGCDSKNLKTYIGEISDKPLKGAGKAPESCIKAKQNFRKYFVDNVAYRKDNVMPARNLKEYFEKVKSGRFPEAYSNK